jgi:hypothetical protein
LIIACGALPCATWLDGTSAGEQDIEELMALLIAKGAVAANIIPDRNWNIAGPGDDASSRCASSTSIVTVAPRPGPAHQRRHGDEQPWQQARR